MDMLGLRVLDVLIDDDEQLEEIYLAVNFRRNDNTFLSYRNQFRLGEVIAQLNQLIAEGLIASGHAKDMPKEWGIASCIYGLTDNGRKMWQIHAAKLGELYKH